MTRDWDNPRPPKPKASAAANIEHSWPAEQVETRPLAAIRRDPRNARTHSDKQIEQIAASMREFGWTIPMLVDEDGQLIAGEGRLLAALRNGYTEGPCMVAIGWSDAKKRAYALADNRLALNAGWNETVLRETMQELEGAFDLENLLGFSTKEIESLLSEEDELAINEVETGAVNDRFWISIRGPLVDQAKALDRLKAALADLPAIEVQLGTIATEL
jgi:ParB-like chromosome segregation protein Spo0J